MSDEPDRRPVVIGNIKNCARCDGEHEGLVANRLTRPHAPERANGYVWTHWTVCPTNGEPILVAFDTPPTEGP